MKEAWKFECVTVLVKCQTLFERAYAAKKANGRRKIGIEAAHFDFFFSGFLGDWKEHPSSMGQAGSRSTFSNIFEIL